MENKSKEGQNKLKTDKQLEEILEDTFKKIKKQAVMEIKYHFATIW